MLFGVWRRRPAGEPGDLQRTLTRQADSMRRHDGFHVDLRDLDGRCGMGRVHLGVLDRGRQPFLSDEGRYALCFDGELYDRGTLCKQHLGRPGWEGDDASLVMALFLEVGWEWLARANGQFAAALYDQQTGGLQLVTDRFGLRPLYCYERPDEVVFAGEVKAILAVGGDFRVDPVSVQEFFSFGQFLEDRTWVGGVRLLPPASVTTLGPNSIETRTYWAWDRVQPRPDSMDVEDAVDEMGRVWIQAVERRVDERRIGLLLSGGLDSRAVLASIPERVEQLPCVTFGVEGCEDHRIAARVAAIRGAQHHFIPISQDNWLVPRLEAVWWTDGGIGIHHLHGIVVVDLLRRTGLFDINMHAFAGDLIFGGSYLLPEFVGARPRDVSARIHKKMRLRNRFFEEDALFDHLSRIIEKYDRTDYFFLNNRVRRFTMNGPLKLETYLFDRKPTFDNDAMEFCYSLPDEWRYMSTTYNRMLLRRFPEYYRDIPWQKTGLPITAGELKHKLYGFARRTERKVRREAGRIGINLPGGQDYTDYDRWTRADPGRTMILDALLSPEARWPEHVERDRALPTVRAHFDGRDSHSDAVLLLFTFETWLQRSGL